ncbi:hypothetical protein [Turicimonas muris]|uniref:hypothetical protein n=1 Tax=Turicimonas muris TaxID=1796652 RepID=UPI002593E26A|nr:hypothetical protein [Turicimonas muris]
MNFDINQIAVNISCHCVQTGIPILNSQESFLGLNAIDFHQRNAKLLKNFVDYGFNVFWVAPKTKLEEAIIHQPRVTDEILSPFYSAVFFHIVIVVNSINLYLNIIGRIKKFIRINFFTPSLSSLNQSLRA